VKKLVILSGAGMSAESGINTFRDKGGWWRNYNPMELATPEAFARDPQLVLDFYNYRRSNVMEAKPNAGHKGLVELEKYFDVQVVTQNVDDLHERAGSSNVLHLHGEIRKARSTANESLVYDLDSSELNLGDTCELGSQLRPHIVWFGEPVSNIEKAAAIVRQADIFAIIGTSLVVYPAAGLVSFLKPKVPIFVINPDTQHPEIGKQVSFIETGAGEGVRILTEKIRHYAD
jgi:NAD-dependent deacetylase